MKPGKANENQGSWPWCWISILQMQQHWFKKKSLQWPEYCGITTLVTKYISTPIPSVCFTLRASSSVLSIIALLSVLVTWLLAQFWLGVGIDCGWDSVLTWCLISHIGHWSNLEVRAPAKCKCCPVSNAKSREFLRVEWPSVLRFSGTIFATEGYPECIMHFHQNNLQTFLLCW